MRKKMKKPTRAEVDAAVARWRGISLAYTVVEKSLSELDRMRQAAEAEMAAVVAAAGQKGKR